MKRLIWMIPLLLVAFGTLAPAQSRGSYFYENSLLRSKLNPAFAPKTNYASFFGVGSFSADIVSNVGLKDFLFPEGDANHLFLSDAVPTDEFLSDLPASDPYVQERLESDLCGFGMKMGEKGYATLSLSLVESGNLVLTNDLLRFVKAGNSAVQSPFQGGSMGMAGYAALSAGYSHDLSSLLEGLRAGARVKLLLGLAAGRFTIDQLGMSFSPEQVSAMIHGTGSLSGLEYDADKGLSLSSPSICGLGAAIDLGASYWLPIDGPGVLNGIEFSASVCDLGSVSFNKNVTSLTLDHQFSFSGVTDFSEDIQSGFEQAINDLMDFTRLESSWGEPFSYGLPASIHVGATAHLWQDKANAGLLYYHTLGHSNLMFACGASPLKWLNVGVNWTFLGPAGRLGFFAEFIPSKYIGLFFGMERASLYSNSRHIPVRNFTENFSFGVNVLFGN